MEDLFDEHQGNIFNLNVDAYVNPVNCVGVMGAGLALQFKKKFPDMFKEYSEDCKNKLVRLGEIAIYPTEPIVICFPTKNHWKDKSKIEDIKSGLADLANIIENSRIESLAIPRLGCGLGGLEWKIVKPIIRGALKKASQNCQIILVSPMGVKWDTSL